MQMLCFLNSLVYFLKMLCFLCFRKNVTYVSEDKPGPEMILKKPDPSEISQKTVNPAPRNYC